MRIDMKSFILGAIVGGCAVVFKASVEVAKDKLIRNVVKDKEEA